MPHKFITTLRGSSKDRRKELRRIKATIKPAHEMRQSGSLIYEMEVTPTQPPSAMKTT